MQKGFQAIAGTPKSTKSLRVGSFLVERSRKTQAENLLKIVNFVDRPVHVSVHKTLNSSRGVIRCRELFDMSEIDIRDELKTQGVVEVYRVTVKKEGKVIPTNTLFLTFNRPDVPKEILVGYLSGASTATSLATQANFVEQQQSANDVGKMNTMNTVIDH